MFGKGVYLADISSKSANYCCSGLTGNVGLLLLCEAELGDPMLELVHSDYNAETNARAANAIATHGLGSSIPAKWKDAGCVHRSLKGVQMASTSPFIHSSGTI
jgi:poly [ADP-ribose] polymerase